MSGLIAHTGQIWLAVELVDMRRGIDGLSMIVQQVLGHPPCAGSAFIFCNRVGNRIKVLLWDGTGVWLCQHRFHQGRFVWTRKQERGVRRVNPIAVGMADCRGGLAAFIGPATITFSGITIMK